MVLLKGEPSAQSEILSAPDKGFIKLHLASPQPWPISLSQLWKSTPASWCCHRHAEVQGGYQAGDERCLVSFKHDATLRPETLCLRVWEPFRWEINFWIFLLSPSKVVIWFLVIETFFFRFLSLIWQKALRQILVVPNFQCHFENAAGVFGYLPQTCFIVQSCLWALEVAVVTSWHGFQITSDQ